MLLALAPLYCNRYGFKPESSSGDICTTDPAPLPNIVSGVATMLGCESSLIVSSNSLCKL